MSEGIPYGKCGLDHGLPLNIKSDMTNSLHLKCCVWNIETKLQCIQRTNEKTNSKMVTLSGRTETIVVAVAANIQRDRAAAGQSACALGVGG